MAELTSAADMRMSSALFTLGVSTRSLDLLAPSGDLHVVVPFPSGMLVGVLDGLGHGVEAAEAAEAGATVLRQHADAQVVEIIQRCHEELHKTRGAVLAVASLDLRANALCWAGVGNIEGMLHRAALSRSGEARISMISRGGVVGYQLPPLRSTTLPLLPGDNLVLATDGIRGDFASESPLDCEPQAFTDKILRQYGKSTDDALVLALRYLGPPS